jgi:hypothetical protein
MAAAERLSLSGTWQVALDPGDAGRAERWFTRDLSQPIELPGSLSDARLGLPVTVETPWIGGIFDRSFFTEPEFAPYRRPGAVKVPFWLQPETHYVGAAWYQRSVTLPAGVGRAVGSPCCWSGRTGARRSGWTGASSAPATPTGWRTPSSSVPRRPRDRTG